MAVASQPRRKPFGRALVARLVTGLALVLLCLVTVMSQNALAGNAPLWSMAGGDAARSGQSPNAGPTAPVGGWSFNSWMWNEYVLSCQLVGRDGTIYWVAGRNVVALRPNGTAKWIKSIGPAYSAAIGRDDTLYVVSSGGRVIALDSKGVQKWVFKCVGKPTPPTIGSDGTIYLGTSLNVIGTDTPWDFSFDDGYLYAVNPDGTQKWVTRPGQVAYPVAVGANGIVYAACASGLRAIEPTLGTQIWILDDAGDPVTAPAVGPDGTVYVGIYNAFEWSTNDLLAVAPNGRRKWSFPVRAAVSGPGIRLTLASPAIARDGTIYVGAATEGVAWSEQTGDGPVTMHEATGELTGELQAYNPDGSLQWKRTMVGPLFNPPSIDRDGTLYAAIGYVGTNRGDWERNPVSGAGQLSAINPDGTQKWAFKTGYLCDADGVYAPAIGANGTIYFGGSNNNFYAVGGPRYPPQLSSPTGAPRHASRGEAAGLYVGISPVHRSGTYPVRIYRERLVAGKWKPYGYVRAKAAFDEKGVTYCTASVVFATRGKWRFRAYAPADGQHLAIWSRGYTYVTVQ